MFTFSCRQRRAAQGLAAACCVAVAFALPVLAIAQTTHAKGRANPSDPAASVPAVGYLSPLANYQRWSDVVPIDWRQANDNVMRIGGWRTYAREAREPAPPAPSAPTTTSAQPASPASAAHLAHPSK